MVLLYSTTAVSEISQKSYQYWTANSVTLQPTGMELIYRSLSRVCTYLYINRLHTIS